MYEGKYNATSFHIGEEVQKKPSTFTVYIFSKGSTGNNSCWATPSPVYFLVLFARKATRSNPESNTNQKPSRWTLSPYQQLLKNKQTKMKEKKAQIAHFHYNAIRSMWQPCDKHWTSCVTKKNWDDRQKFCTGNRTKFRSDYAV